MQAKPPAATPSNDNSPGAPPNATVKQPNPRAPENLGHEGAKSTVKRNTTEHGERQDRGP
jgi:hypothetical protein